jgi:hypothetical protein
MQTAHLPLLQLLQCLGQEMQDPLLSCSPFPQAVHVMMSAGAQSEQDIEHPLQVPPLTANPFLQSVQTVLLVQARQLRAQDTQLAPLKYCPGRHSWQLVAVPLQVMQVASQGWQVADLRKAPDTQEEQLRGLEVLQVRQLGPQLKHVAELESRTKAVMQVVHTPVEQSLQPGGHSLISPPTITPDMLELPPLFSAISPAEISISSITTFPAVTIYFNMYRSPVLLNTLMTVRLHFVCSESAMFLFLIRTGMVSCCR